MPLMDHRMIRIFISSTFRDFREERDILAKQVFPALQQYCEERAFSFQTVDLRWGISQQDAFDQKTVEICLEEIRRCQSISPRPNFLILVGNYYGWTPLPPWITEEEWARLTASLAPSAEALLTRWYRQDENDRERRFLLQPRTGDWLDESVWGKTENELRTLLFPLAAERLEDPRSLRRFGLSATEQEICEGLFDIPDAREHTFVLCRDTGGEYASQQEQLRRKLEAQLGGSAANRVCHFRPGETGWVETVRRFLMTVIDQRIQETAPLTPWEQEQENLHAALRMEAETCVPRPALNTAFSRFLKGAEGKTVLLTGPSGSGKSLFLRSWLSDHPDRTVGFFSDILARDRTLPYAVWFLARSALALEPSLQAQALALTPPDLPSCFSFLERTLREMPPGPPVLLILDCAEGISGWKQAHGSLLNLQLPKRFTLIVSCISPKALPEKDRAGLDPGLIFSLSGLNPPQAEAMLRESLQRIGRSLTAPQWRKVLSALPKEEEDCTPLYLSLLADYCREVHSYDSLSAAYIPDSAEEMILSRLEHLAESWYPVLTQHALTYLALSPIGLTEMELQSLLAADEEVVSEIHKQTEWEFDLQRGIPTILWARLYYAVRTFFSEVWQEEYLVLLYRHAMFPLIVECLLEEKKILGLAQAMIGWFSSRPWSGGGSAADVRKKEMLYGLYRRLGDQNGLRTLLTDPLFLDCSIRRGEYSALIERLTDWERRWGRDRDIHAVLELLWSRPTLFQTWPDSWLPAACAAGLAHRKLLTASGRSFVLAAASTAPRSQSFSIPGVPLISTAMRGDHILAIQTGGTIQLYNCDLRSWTGIQTASEITSGILYWQGDVLVLRTNYLRIFYRYTGTELFELRRTTHPEYVLQLDRSLTDQDSARKRFWGDGGGWAEQETFSADPYFAWEGQAGYAEGELHYPAGVNTVSKRWGNRAAVLVDGGRVEILDLERKVLLASYETQEAKFLEWVASGTEVYTISGDERITLYPAPFSGAGSPAPALTSFPQEESNQETFGMILDNLLQLPSMLDLRYNLTQGSAQDAMGDRAARTPQLTAFSAEGGWVACYYRRHLTSTLRLFDLSTGALLGAWKVLPIQVEESWSPCLYSRNRGEELVLRQGGRRHVLNIAAGTWSHEPDEEEEDHARKESLRTAYTQAVHHLLRQDTLEETVPGDLPLAHRIRESAFNRVLQFLGGIVQSLFHVDQSSTPLERIRRMRIERQETPYGPVWWGIDSALGIITVWDNGGNCLCRDQAEQPFVAAEVHGTVCHVLLPNFQDTITWTLEGEDAPPRYGHLTVIRGGCSARKRP